MLSSLSQAVRAPPFGQELMDHAPGDPPAPDFVSSALELPRLEHIFWMRDSVIVACFSLQRWRPLPSCRTLRKLSCHSQPSINS